MTRAKALPVGQSLVAQRTVGQRRGIVAYLLTGLAGHGLGAEVSWRGSSSARDIF